MDLEIALEFVNQVLKNKVSRNLRPPEITVFCGTWQGITYEQMAESSAYSANYLMRDIAPKLWKLLSTVFAENIGKSNLKIQLCQLYDSSQIRIRVASKLGNGQQNVLDSWQSAIAFSSVFYGREDEIKTVAQWALDDRCQLIKLWGLSGIGKTLLMKKIGEQLQEHYEIVIWRSLTSAPKSKDLALDLLNSMGVVTTNADLPLFQLIEQMRLRRCLIMLDGLESILQSQAFNGQYGQSYADYHEFFQTIGSSSHNSCMIATSLENFGRTMLVDSNTAIRNLRLTGLSKLAAKSVFRIGDENSAAKTEAVERLIDYYQGNPAILSFVAQIVRKLFNGNIDEFLAQRSLVFGEINQLLNKSFKRLSSLEKEILYWLASGSQAMSLSEIQTEIPLSIYPVELIEALKSLNQRSLVEATQIQQRSVFDLSPMIREFIVNQFITQIGNNFSLANRQNSSLSQGTIELGNTYQIGHLSNWLQNRFEPDWQPVEILLAASGRSPARLRSAFSLRGADVIKRFKQIQLGTDNPVGILLVIAVSQLESAFKICVQAQPTLQNQILPNSLELSLIDPDDVVLAAITAQAEDNFIQLPYFRGAKNEKFVIGISLNADRYREKFLI